MSIKVMSRVWDGSKQKGTNLVALLAIADHADDYGVAWPGLDLIAKKARVKKRQAINLVEKLEANGELIVIHNRGRHISNRYFITVGLSVDEIKITLDTHSELQVGDEKGAKDCTLSTRKGERNCTISRRKGAKDCTNYNEEKVQFPEEKVQFSTQKGAIAIAPEPSKEPSENHKREPSTASTKPKPLAVHVFRSVVERFPHKATWKTIDQTVGDKQDDLEFWEQVISRWIACGWNPQNVNGMLDHFKSRRLPKTGKPEITNGQSPTEVTPDLAETLKRMEREIGT